MKTYLSPTEQVKLTLALVEQVCGGLGYYLMAIGEVGHLSRVDLWSGTIGQIIKPHRLFLPGDIIWVNLNNGQAERWPVYGISSKGYAVRGFYLQYARWRSDFRIHRRGSRITAVNLPGKPTQFKDKVFRFIEFPGRLVGKPPSNPDVQRFLAETRCAWGSAESGKRR